MIKELRDPDDFGLALDYAVRLLGRCARTTAEIKERMERKGFSGAVADQVVTRLQSDGYLNDREFVRYWGANRVAEKPMGRRRLVAELRRKGIDEETIAGETELLYSPRDDLTMAMELAEKRWQAMRGWPPEKAWSRLGAFLQRRGFEWETIEAVRQHFLDTICNND